jgi:hypothetical protein
MNRFLKSLLKTAAYLVEQIPDKVDRVSSRVSDMTDHGKRAIYGEKDHTVRDVVSFAAGVGLGIGAGILFAPASGEETRNSLRGKVQEIGDRVRERFSPDKANAAGGQKHPDH